MLAPLRIGGTTSPDAVVPAVTETRLLFRASGSALSLYPSATDSTSSRCIGGVGSPPVGGAVGGGPKRLARNPGDMGGETGTSGTVDDTVLEPGASILSDGGNGNAIFGGGLFGET